MDSLNDIPVLSFVNPEAWEGWLAEHYELQTGIWLKIAKKASGIPSVTHLQALDVALCYGWIDGQGKPDDDKYYLQKFTPRRPKSLWSRVNIGKVEKLVQEGRMQAPGLVVIEAARADGRWDAAYASQREATPPPDLVRALNENPEAETFYATLNKTNRYSCIWRLLTAKTPATRQRRLENIVQTLARRQVPR